MELQLTQNNFSKTISYVYKYIDFYKSSPMVWNNKKNIMELKSANKMKWLRRRFIYGIVYCIIGAFSVFKNWHRSDPLTKGYGMFGVGGFAWSLSSYYVYIYRGQDCANFLNALIAFENKELVMLKKRANLNLNSNEKSSKEIFMKLTLLVMSLANHWCLVFHSNAFFHPCFPINVGYHLSEYCQDSLGLNAGNIPWDNPREFAVRLMILVTGLFMWLSICSNSMGVAVLLIVKGHCISSYINYYTRLSKVQNLTNRQSKHVCMLFRQIQVMLAEFRNIYSTKAILPKVFGMVIVQITMAFIWIDLARRETSGDNIHIIAIGVFCSVQLLLMCLYGFGTLGKVYGTSVSSKEEIRANKTAMRRKQYRKFVNACPLLKINVGDQNFLEPSTPLVIEEVIVDNLIGVLAV